MPNLTDELSTAKERRLNQFGTAVLVWCGKSVKFDRVCRTFVELNLGSTHSTPSESDVAPVSLQSRTYSVRFGTCKVRRLNQASDVPRLRQAFGLASRRINLCWYVFFRYVKPLPHCHCHAFSLKRIQIPPLSSFRFIE